MTVPLSLEEFKQNKLASESDLSYDFRARPDRFLRFIGSYKLIYGREINPALYPIRSDEVAFEDQIKTLGLMIPLLEGNKIDLQTVIKELFWTTEMELILQGVEVDHSFKSIDRLVKNAGHIIHLGLELRDGGVKNEDQVKNFVRDLKDYVKRHEKLN